MASSAQVNAPALTENTQVPSLTLHEHLRRAETKLGRELTAQEEELEYNLWKLREEGDYPEFDDD